MRSVGLIAFAVMALLVLSAAMSAVAEVNLLLNPGFEDGLTSWGYGGRGDRDVDWFTDGTAHGGDRYASLWAEDGGDGWIYQNPSACAQSLELYYRDYWEGDSQLTIDVHYSGGDRDAWELVGNAEYPQQSEEWGHFKEELNPTKQVEEVGVYVLAEEGEYEAWLDVDDFDLEACPAAATTTVTTTLTTSWTTIIGGTTTTTTFVEGTTTTTVIEGTTTTTVIGGTTTTTTVGTSMTTSFTTSTTTTGGTASEYVSETREVHGYLLVIHILIKQLVEAVGGFVESVNKLSVLAPWLAVIGLVGCIGTAAVVAKKRRS